MARHDCDFGVRELFLDFAKQVRAGEIGELQVRHDDIRRRHFELFNCRLCRLRLGAEKTDSLADRHAQAAYVLFVVHDQKMKFEFVFHGFPIVFSITSMSCWIRKGFSTTGVCARASISRVSALAVSPVMKTM